MDQLELKDISFRYPGIETNVLHDISIKIQSGEFTVICGPSGCGKTTLLKMIKRDIAPVGNMSGQIFYGERPLDSYSPSRLAKDIGMVFQDPDNQIVMDDVMQELVFGMENLGYSTSDMQKRVAEMVHFFGLEPLLKHKTHELSGGQKQTLNLASVLLLEPKILLLDEPTSQLDPIASQEFMTIVRRVNQEFGITVILVEHQLEETAALADRLLMMNEGEVLYDGAPRHTFLEVWEKNDSILTQYLPTIPTLYLEYGNQNNSESLPLTVKEGQQWLKGLTINQLEEKEVQEKMVGTPILTAKELCFRYEKDSRQIIDHLSLELYSNECLTIVGSNGSGKSTLIKVLLGLLKTQKGRVTYKGKRLTKPVESMAYLPQNPKQYFLEETVEKELERIAQSSNSKETRKRLDQLISMLDIGHVLGQHPYDLSGGEMQKAALACVLLQQPDILFIDEPTKGLDPLSKQQLGQHIQAFIEEGMAVVLVTHDIEFAARYSTRCAMMFNGNMTLSGPANEFFKGNTFYTTVINRMTRNHSVPEVLTLEEAREKWHIPDGSSL